MDGIFLKVKFIKYNFRRHTNQGKWNDILTNNSKGKFPHNPLPLFLPFLPTPLQLHKKIYFHLTLKGFVIFCRIDC